MSLKAFNQNISLVKKKLHRIRPNTDINATKGIYEIKFEEPNTSINPYFIQIKKHICVCLNGKIQIFCFRLLSIFFRTVASTNMNATSSRAHTISGIR